MKKSDELKTTLKDYIDLLNKYNANMEFYNARIRDLMNSNKVMSNVVSFAIIVLSISIAWNVYFLITY